MLQNTLMISENNGENILKQGWNVSDAFFRCACFSPPKFQWMADYQAFVKLQSAKQAC